MDRQILLHPQTMRIPSLIKFGAVAWLGGIPAMAEVPYVFEGRMERVDAELVNDLRSGWVLAGSFLESPAAEDRTVEGSQENGRLSGGISGIELTVDHYRILRFEAFGGNFSSGIAYQNEAGNGRGQDFVGLDLALDGTAIGDGDRPYRASWLQIWLYDNRGRMLEGMPTSLERVSRQWEYGWFRLLFSREGESDFVFAEGSLTVFREWDEEATSEPVDWEGLVHKMAGELLERDATIAEQAETMSRLRSRITGLTHMVDRLLEEREWLEEELKRVQAIARPEESSLIEDVASLQAATVLQAEEIENLNKQRDKLEERLGASEAMRREAVRELESLTRQLMYLEEAYTQLKRNSVVDPVIIREEKLSIDTALIPEATSAENSRKSRNAKDAEPVRIFKGPRKYR